MGLSISSFGHEENSKIFLNFLKEHDGQPGTIIDIFQSRNARISLLLLETTTRKS